MLCSISTEQRVFQKEISLCNKGELQLKLYPAFFQVFLLCAIAALPQMERSQVHFFLLKESSVSMKLKIIFEVNYLTMNREILNFSSKGCFDLSFISLPPLMEARVTSVFTLNKQAGDLAAAPVCVHAKSLQSCPALCNPMDCSLPLSMEFSSQEYQSGFPFPSPWDLPDPGIEPWFPALQADSLPSLPWLRSSCS